MPLRRYRMTVLVCSLSWLLVGLHLPTLHEVMDHGYTAPPSVLVMTVLLALVGVTCLWMLLRPGAAGA